jgi:hypothetical protein
MYAQIDDAGLLTTGEVCRRLGISESGYHRLEAAGVFPKPLRLGRAPRPAMRVFKLAQLAHLRLLLDRHREESESARGPERVRRSD